MSESKLIHLFSSNITQCCSLWVEEAIGVVGLKSVDQEVIQLCVERELKGLGRSWPIWEGCLCFFNYELFQQQNIYNPVKKMDKGLEYTVLQRRHANGQ